MTSKNLQKWAQIRIKGKAHFVLVKGVLLWGVSTAIIWSIFMQWGSPAEVFYTRPLAALAAFAVAGYFWGILTWHLSEREFSRTKIERAGNY